ncbi:hypothetical protein ACSQ67_020033 [Phaseolus vulgaris]
MDQQTTINARINNSSTFDFDLRLPQCRRPYDHTTTDICSYLRLEVLPFSLLRNIDDDGTNICYPIE